MYEKVEDYGREIEQAEEAAKQYSDDTPEESSREAYRFFKLVLRGPAIMEMALEALQQWNDLTLDFKLELAKIGAFFQNQVAGVMETGGSLLLRFQRDASQVPDGQHVVDTFREALESFVSCEAMLSNAIKDILAEEGRQIALLQKRPGVGLSLQQAHERGLAEAKDGLGEVYSGEKFWEDRTA